MENGRLMRACSWNKTRVTNPADHETMSRRYCFTVKRSLCGDGEDDLDGEFRVVRHLGDHELVALGDDAPLEAGAVIFVRVLRVIPQQQRDVAWQDGAHLEDGDHPAQEVHVLPGDAIDGGRLVFDQKAG